MFNYFLPGLTKHLVAPGDKLDGEVLAQVGLGEVLADCHQVPLDASVLDVRKGCGGLGGCCIAPARKYRGAPDVLFSHERQQWLEVAGGKLWLGVERGAAVSPSDLERRRTIGGSAVQDDAHHDWIIPIARTAHAGYEFGALPQTYRLDAQTLEPQAQLAASHAWLWALSGEIRSWYIAAAAASEDAAEGEQGNRSQRPFAELIRAAARLLGVNYRLGPHELNVLHDLGCPLLTRDTVHAICQTSYGFEVLEEAKKKPPASDSSPAASSSSSKTGGETLAAAPLIAPA